MIDVLLLLLRIAGAGLILLAFLHFPMAARLEWRREAARMSALNAMVFHVHTFFLCFVLIAMGLPALMDPMVFLTPTRAGLWGCGSLAIFWGLRLIAQWTVYRPSWWKGQRFETAIHYLFTVVWLYLSALFATCTAVQVGWVRLQTHVGA